MSDNNETMLTSAVCDIPRALLLAKMLLLGGSDMFEGLFAAYMLSAAENDDLGARLSLLDDLSDQSIQEIQIAYEAMAELSEPEPFVAERAVRRSLSALESLNFLISSESGAMLDTENAPTIKVTDEASNTTTDFSLLNVAAIGSSRTALAGMFISILHNDLLAAAYDEEDMEDDDEEEYDQPPPGMCHSLSVLYHACHGLNRLAEGALDLFAEFNKAHRKSTPVRNMIAALKSMMQDLPECSMFAEEELAEHLIEIIGEGWKEATLTRYCDVVFAADRLLTTDKCSEETKHVISFVVEVIQAWIAEAEIHQKEQERITA